MKSGRSKKPGRRLDSKSIAGGPKHNGAPL
jgi:hypothetical protein